MNVYTIYDSVANEHGPLFEAKNDMVALRNVKMQLEQVPEVYRKEYNLKMIGTYDRENGLLTSEDAPIIIEIPEETKDE